MANTKKCFGSIVFSRIHELLSQIHWGILEGYLKFDKSD